MRPPTSASPLANIAPRRVCLIKPSALGDVVQTLPLLDVLRQKFPAAEISWVIRSDLANLLEGHPALAETLVFHRTGGWRAWRDLLKTLYQRRFDLVLDLQGLLRTGVMTLATRAPWRVGLETAREGSAFSCNYLIPETGRTVPAHARYWRIAEELGLADHPATAHIPVSAADASSVAGQLAQLPRPLLAMHAGAGWVTKRWPVEKFAEIARRFSGSIVAVGSPGEASLAEAIVTAAADAGRPALNLAGKTTLKQLAAVLQSVDLMVSNDSGPMHLAAAVGTPVAGIFTCTSPVLSGPAPDSPNGVRHVLISADVPCRASYKKTCPHSGPGHLCCLADLSVERVWQAVEQLQTQQTLIRRPA
ncbi:MAG: glycosyltransferase family 9 protein [Planctomycetes bacterium]|nr:glycosyltransferase family 9 protein [Planctomycetota bacterium]